ncbi:hypothetical protein B0I31_10664 [Saccharothrix carnea]|uniref:Uncharacterized protein n=1 Tax=Saccharothrix carnea TaxID=1280637 RepID=A0A2P8I7X9_SACCR|nr:hypothetical protein B0I31_10664 [Saccharothrix carnea]
MVGEFSDPSVPGDRETAHAWVEQSEIVTRPPTAALLTACAAVLITIAGLVIAWSLRPPAATDPGAATPRDELRCGATACRSVVKQEVGVDSVELVVGEGAGRIRTSGASGPNIFELTIASSGARIDASSLQCVDAEVAVCLVRGAVNGEVLGEVLVRRSGAWSRAQLPYLASGAYLALHDVNKDTVADVVAVQRACQAGADCSRWFAQVFSLAAGGGELGCTPVVREAESLPGWPTVTPDPSDLRQCGA